MSQNTISTNINKCMQKKTCVHCHGLPPFRLSLRLSPRNSDPWESIIMEPYPPRNYTYPTFHGELIVIPWMWPPPSNSHHQDYYMFSRGSRDPNLNLHLPRLHPGRGAFTQVIPGSSDRYVKLLPKLVDFWTKKTSYPPVN